MRPQSTRAALADRIDELIPVLAAEGANLDVRTGRQAVERGVDQLVGRGILTESGHRLRVRDRLALRYYARTLQHLVARGRESTH
jgi:hypothetical protein